MTQDATIARVAPPPLGEPLPVVVVAGTRVRIGALAKILDDPALVIRHARPHPPHRMTPVPVSVGSRLNRNGSVAIVNIATSSGFLALTSHRARDFAHGRAGRTPRGGGT